MMEDVNITKPEHFTFLFEEPENGWWLKIDNGNDLLYYYEITRARWSDYMEDYIENAARYDETLRPDAFNHSMTYAILLHAQERGLSILDACTQFRMKIAFEQLEAIREDGYIVINENGGYHSGPVKYSQFVHRKTFTWPDFAESDIRIKQFRAARTIMCASGIWSCMRTGT